jgi:hypothetical protein
MIMMPNKPTVIEKLCGVRATLRAQRRNEEKGDNNEYDDSYDEATAAAEATDRPQSLLRKSSTTATPTDTGTGAPARIDDGSRDYELPDGEVITLDEPTRSVGLKINRPGASVPCLFAHHSMAWHAMVQ